MRFKCCAFVAMSVWLFGLALGGVGAVEASASGDKSLSLKPTVTLSVDALCGSLLDATCQRRRYVRRVRRGNRAANLLTTIGGIVLGASYGYSLLTSIFWTIEGRSGEPGPVQPGYYYGVFLPLVGPFLWSAHSFTRPYGSGLASVGQVLVNVFEGIWNALVGLIQVTGAVLLFVGLALPQRRPGFVQKQRDRGPTFAVVPVVSPHMTGLAISGTM